MDIYLFIKTNQIVDFKHVQLLYINYTSKKLFLKACHISSHYATKSTKDKANILSVFKGHCLVILRSHSCHP